MWAHEHTATSPLPRQAIWEAIRDLHSGELSYEGADTFELHGPFAVGTAVSITPRGQETVQSTIIDIVDGECYADLTELGDIALEFRHTLRTIDGGTEVTHRLQITGAGADTMGPVLGPQIAADFGQSMAALFEQAEKRTETR